MNTATQPTDRATRPANVEERALWWLAGKILGRLGRLAGARADRHTLNHVALALMLGNTEEPAHTPCVLRSVPYEAIAARYKTQPSMSPDDV